MQYIPRLNAQVFKKSYILWYIAMAIFSTVAFIFVGIDSYIVAHYQRWDDISPCSKSLTPAYRCDKLPPTNVVQITFDHSTIAFGGCYACTRYLFKGPVLLTALRQPSSN